jgi:hypothetical protein
MVRLSTLFASLHHADYKKTAHLYSHYAYINCDTGRSGLFWPAHLFRHFARYCEALIIALSFILPNLGSLHFK